MNQTDNERRLTSLLNSCARDHATACITEADLPLAVEISMEKALDVDVYVLRSAPQKPPSNSR